MHFDPYVIHLYYQTGNVLLLLLVMNTYSYYQFSHIGYMILIIHHSSRHFHDFPFLTQQFLLLYSSIFF